MSDIDITKEHHLDIETSRVMMVEMAENLAKKYNAKYSINGDSLQFSALGIDGIITLSHNKVNLKAKLGFLMKAMKGALERQIEDEFNKILATSTI